MSEEKKTHPEHKYSVTFVSKVGTKTKTYPYTSLLHIFQMFRSKNKNPTTKFAIVGIINFNFFSLLEETTKNFHEDLEHLVKNEQDLFQRRQHRLAVT